MRLAGLKLLLILIFILNLCPCFGEDYWSSEIIRLKEKGILLDNYPELITAKQLQDFLEIAVKDNGKKEILNAYFEEQNWDKEKAIKRKEICNVFYHLFLKNEKSDEKNLNEFLLTYHDGKDIEEDYREAVALCLKYEWLPLREGNKIAPDDQVRKTDMAHMFTWAYYPVITIAEINDFQGYIIPKIYSWSEGKKVGGAAYLAGFYETLKGKHSSYTLFLDGGDAISPSPYGNLTKGQAVLDIYNAIGIEALTVGNHEFDYGIERLKEIIGEAKFPFLGANVFYKGTGKRPDWIKPFVILNKGPLKIALLGFVQETTATTTTPEYVASLEFRPVVKVCNEFLPELKKKSDITILLTSIPAYTKEKDGRGPVTGPLIDVAKEGLVDAIISGDNHIRVESYIGHIPVVQAESSGMAMGVIKLEYDSVKKEVIKSDVNVFTTFSDETKPVENIEKIVDHYMDKIAVILSQQIGYTDTGFTRNTFKESTAGNLITDIIRDITGTQMAFYNSGGLRQNIPPGPVTIGNIYEMNPFDSPMATLELTGKQIKGLMERTAIGEGEKDLTGKPTKGILQVSGIKVKIDTSRPIGDRVISMELNDGTPLGMEKSYSVGTVTFLADGGDGYEQFKEGKNVKNTFLILRDGVIDWVKKKTAGGYKIDRQIEGRINIINNNQ